MNGASTVTTFSWSASSIRRRRNASTAATAETDHDAADVGEQEQAADVAAG